MDILISLIAFTIVFLAGYFVGNREAQKDLKEKVEEITAINAPKPGVVERLSEEALQEKQNPQKRGNLEAFNEFFKKYPIIK